MIVFLGFLVKKNKTPISKNKFKERKMMQRERLAVGVDLGGTKIDVGLVDESGRLFQHKRLETEVAKGPQYIQDTILETIRHLEKEASTPILGIGIGVAGQIDRETGDVIFAPNLKWNNIPLRANFEKATHLPVRIINDARALTMGEWCYGAGKGHLDILCLFIGTGIGGGVVSGGSLLQGGSNTLGEVGHMTIDFNGPVCTCGKKGCLEAFAGGWAIGKRAREWIETNPNDPNCQNILEMAGNDLSKVNAYVVIQAMHKGNTVAIEMIEKVKTALIAGCASLVNAFNPARLILGGGLIEGMPEIISAIDEGVRKDSLKAATKSLEIVRAKLGKELGILGSAAVIFDLLKGAD